MDIKEKKTTYCFDIDGTICTDSNGNYKYSKPNKEVIKSINCLHNKGCKIVIHTARGGTTGKDWTELTNRQLKSWGVKYHKLVFGKPAADFYIDDKGVNTREWLKIN